MSAVISAAMRSCIVPVICTCLPHHRPWCTTRRSARSSSAMRMVCTPTSTAYAILRTRSLPCTCSPLGDVSGISATRRYSSRWATSSLRRMLVVGTWILLQAIVTAQPRVQSRLGDAEQRGGPGLVVEMRRHLAGEQCFDLSHERIGFRISTRLHHLLREALQRLPELFAATRRAAQEIFGQRRRLDDVIVAQQHDLFEDVLQLAHVAGPAVLLEELDGLGGKTLEGLALRGAALLQELLRDQKH